MAGEPVSRHWEWGEVVEALDGGRYRVAVLDWDVQITVPGSRLRAQGR